jgi:transposase-like protein
MKSLRMTIKAHLKTELKRRTAQASNGSATPAAVAPTPTPAPAEAVSLPQEISAPENEPTHEDDTKYIASEATVEAANDEGAVAPSIEEQDPAHGDMSVQVNHGISRWLKSDG